MLFRIKKSTLYFTMAVLLSSVTGCEGPGGGDIGNPASASEQLFQEGLDQLSQGNFKEATVTFNELLLDSEYQCEAHYGKVLAGVQDTADRLDVIADAASLVIGSAPGLNPQQSFDIGLLVENFLDPFEGFFEQIMVGLDYVVENDCRVTVPEGMPVEIGNPDTLIYFKAVLGYEFDPASARAGQSAFSSLLASIKFILAHDMEIKTSELNDTVDTIVDAFTGSAELEVNGPGDVTQHTLLSAVRALGIVPDSHQNLLTLGDQDRFEEVDNHSLKALRALYHDNGETETGLLPQLEIEAARDEDTSNNFLGLIDVNANGVADAGDSVLIGLREIHIAGLFSEPSIDGGILINFNPGLGDIDDIIEAGHGIIQTVGDQMASVDDSSVSSKPLGLNYANDLIDAIGILDLFLEPLPEAVEFDFGAYFKTPVGLRELFPYWIDGELLIEGESWVTTTSEPYVLYGDEKHFQGAYTFQWNDDSDPVTLNTVAIDSDSIEPSEYSLLVSLPLPYVAYQDPSLNGVLHVNVDELYGSKQTTNKGFVPADMFSANMATASYFSFVLNEWVLSP